MQKFVIGCAAVVLLLVVGGGTAGYFFVIKPGWEFVSEVGEFTTEFQSLNSQIERTDGFVAPADGQLDPERFQRFLVAQRDLRGLLEEELAAEGRDANMLEVFTAYRDLGELLLTAKTAQVQVLNRYQFSLDEYVWTRNQTFRALGEQVAVAAVGDQGRAALSGQVSDEVMALVEPHREELMQSYVMAWFGL